MKELITELFDNTGYIRSGEPNFEKISEASLGDIVDFCNQFAEITYYKNLNKPARSIYAHAASTGLGGGRKPCSNPDCRLDRIEELTQFASLYSDKVYINNFLWDLLPLAHHTNSIDRLLPEFAGDMLVMSKLLPLISEGIVLPITFKPICPHCLTVHVAGQSDKVNYNLACSELEDQYYSEVKYSIVNEDGVIKVKVTGSETLLPHGDRSLSLVDGIIEQKLPSVAKKLIESKELPLTKNQARKLATGKELAFHTIESAAFELGSSQLLGTSYLTDSELEIDFIRNLSSDPIARRRTALMQKYLSCTMPFIDSVDPKELICLRKAEEESFILFRSSLSKAINEYQGVGETFSERDALAIYADIVQPHLAELDKKVKKAKHHFFKGTRRKITGWVGALSVGMYTGFITANALTGAAAFGAVKAGSELIDWLMSESDAEEEIKDDSFYFLWKAKKLSKK